MCFTGRLSRLINVLVGYYSDINISITENEIIRELKERNYNYEVINN